MFGTSPFRRAFLLYLLLLATPGRAVAGPVLVDGLAPDAAGSFDANLCRGCTPDRDITGLCDNDCVTCQDAGRPTFAGDNSTTGCAQFDGNQAACEDAWFLTGNGVPVSCFYLTGSCFDCSASNQLLGLCTSSCLPCGDAARTTFAGGSFPDSCRTYDGNQTTCETAYQLGGDSIPTTCFYAAGECHACDITQRLLGNCTNTCVTCDAPGHTTFRNGFGDDGCVALANDQAACESSWYRNGQVPAPCFYTDGTEQNQGGFLFIEDGFDRIGPLVTNGRTLAVCIGCNGTTAVGGFEHGFDESTLPGLGWSRATVTELGAIDAFLAGTGTPGLDDAGIVYMPSQQTDSSHNGISQEQVDAVNARTAELKAFVDAGGGLFVHNQARLRRGFAWLDDVVAGVTARSGETCRDALALTATGASRLPQVSDDILQTLNDESPGYFIGDPTGHEIFAQDQCRDVTCKDPAHTTFLGGGPDAPVCGALAGNAAACDASWYLDVNGHPAVCSAETPSSCIGCGRNEMGEDPCPNTCGACDDAARTLFTGDLSSPGCEGLAADQSACAIAWQGGGDGLSTSCFFDGEAGFCRACTTENENLGLCTNTCEAPPATRTVVFGPGGVTTTTLPGGCDGPPAPTFESILCRLEQLIALVQGSDDLGKTRGSLLRFSSKARDKTRTAQRLVGGKRKKVRNPLHKASRKMVGFNFRVRSRTGRRLIPEAKRTALLALGEPILADMRTLLKSL